MNHDKGYSRLRAILSILTFLGLGVACFKYLDLKAMWTAWQKFTWGTIGWLLLLPALYLLFKGLRFVVLMRPVCEVSRKDILAGFSASQAASLLPGGVAMRAAMMHRVGADVEESSGPVLANSASDQFLLLTAGLILCYYYRDLRTSAFILTGFLALLITVLSIERSREWVKAKLRALAGHFNKEDRMERFFSNLVTLADPVLFAKVMFWTVPANAVSLGTLCLVVHAFGFPVEPWPLAAAFVVPNLLGRLSPLPAGAGVVEAGMVGFMAAQTKMSYDQAAAVTVIFRIVDVVMPALYGGLCHLLLLPEERESKESTGDACLGYSS